ncbi:MULTISPECIES: YjcZ family sporulation protein [Paenibacillus]|nr:YjcZ family sporulation protein [Paenibacillus sp. HGF5]
MSCEKGGYNGYGSPVGTVLVLFILLVIILGTFWI